MKNSIVFAVGVAFLGLASGLHGYPLEKTVLAEGGKALFPIVISEKASPQTKANALKLADYLEKMTGGKFLVEKGDGRRGILIGVAADFPALKHGVMFDLVDILRREDYLLRSHAQGIWILGATDLAVQHGVWDFLHRLGYRQFFPGPHWEIIPSMQKIEVVLDALEKPSYHSRTIWYGFGAWDYAKEPYRDWCEKNRAMKGVNLNTGHAYDGIVKSLKKDFTTHPEFWPLLNKERKEVRNPKPCLGNAELRARIVAQAVDRVKGNPLLDSVSMDPSDGGGWCDCETCARLGSVSDQAITLANEVAAGINEKYPGKLVGIYAYNYHSPPPSIKVHPKVIVSVATAFIKGGQSLEDIIAGWAGKGATLGVREYYSVNTWDRDQPGHARGGNLDYLQRTIPEFHAKGARYMSAESSDNWGPNGLGYYFASRLLWKVSEAKNRSAIEGDFLERCFGPASQVMKEFYDQIDSSKPHLVVDDQLGRMYRSLQKARELSSAVPIIQRLDDLTLYARYCTLYHRYATAVGPARQAAFESLIRHAYRMRSTMMVHAYALYRDLAGRDKTVSLPTEARWQVLEGKNPWKSSKPFSADEVDNFLKDGIASHKLLELNFKPLAYGTNLLPAASGLTIPPGLLAGDFTAGRGVQTFFTHVKKGPAEIELNITGGLIAHYRDRGNVKVELYQVGGASQTGEKESLVQSNAAVPPDGKERKIKLTLPQPGLYKIVIKDGQDRTLVTWPKGQLMTVASTQDSPMNRFYGLWMGYFYVPRGAKVIGLFGGEHGEVRDSQDRPHFWLNGRENNYYSVPVPPGEDGKFWRVRYCRGSIRLLTVPPYFARSPEELLLPAEVIAKDAGK
ncbi:MAG: DUF4838 domain-containing protein [Gemmataceae bacterium]|nr:DUF4838 domain-containing protein [Gemmataceae bacterium]